MLVHRPAYDDWTLPKGKLEAGETPRAAAVREVREETGLDCLLGPALGAIAYVDAGGRDKTVDYWLVAATTEELAPTKEIDAARWLPLAEALAKLSHDRDRDVLRRAATSLSDARSVSVRLVRHARAGRRDRWRGRDELRPLTASGRAQAAALAGELAPRGPALLVSSPAVRCVQTLEPLAGDIGLPVQRHDALAEAASAADALALLGAAAVLGETVACTHGDVQTAVIEALGAVGAALSKPLRFAKGSTWELTFERGRFTAGRYLPAPV